MKIKFWDLWLSAGNVYAQQDFFVIWFVPTIKVLKAILTDFGKQKLVQTSMKLFVYWY